MKKVLLWSLLLSLATMPASAVDPFRILLVNDDGVDAPGIAAMAKALATDPSLEVTIVAPTEQQSGKGTALTIHGDLPLRPHAPIAGFPAWSVDATPATTARVGLSVVLSNNPPDLVISGINKGENVGRIAWYSGTVGAAREAILAGSSSVALSLQLNWADPRPDFEDAARWALPVIEAIRQTPLPKGVYLNVNIPQPPSSIHGYRLCRMGLEAPQVAGFDLLREEEGVRYLKSRWAPAHGRDPGSDTAALHQGWVTMTPLQLDSTKYSAFPELENLMNLPLPEDHRPQAHTQGDPENSSDQAIRPLQR